MQAIEDDTHRCGHRLSETSVDRGRDDPWVAEDGVCWACHAIANREKALGDDRIAGQYVYVRRVQPLTA